MSFLVVGTVFFFFLSSFFFIFLWKLFGSLIYISAMFIQKICMS